MPPIRTSGSDSPQNVLTVAARPWDRARVGKCYNNVNEMIRQYGGELAYGWALADVGPHRCSGHHEPAPLYRRWLNHVVWRDTTGTPWEVTPNAVIDNHKEWCFASTEFLPDAAATFEIVSHEKWFTRPCRYLPTRPDGLRVAELLSKAQFATGDDRESLVRQALNALTEVGFRPREWKIETIGERTGSIWLIAE